MGGWLAFVGLAMVAVWAWRYFSGGAAGADPEFGFRSAAEALTALAAVVFGVAGLLRRARLRLFGFASLGAVTAAGAAAMSRGLEQGQLVAGLAFGAVALLSIAVLFVGRGTDVEPEPRAVRSQFAYFGVGLSLYALLAGASVLRARGDWPMVAVHVVAFALLLYAAALPFRTRRLA